MPTPNEFNEFNCGKCNKLIPKHIRIIKCDSCKKFLHVKCCGVNHKTFNSLKQLNNVWNCDKCVKHTLNTADISTESDVTECKPSNSISTTKFKKKSKCGKCLKIMREDHKCIRCDACTKYFHVKCSGTSKNDFL